MRLIANQKRAGLSLLEVIVSTAIFFLSIIAIYGLLDMGQRDGENARQRGQALRIAQARLVWNGTSHPLVRNFNDEPGPYEQALVGTPVADPAKPLEVVRTIHSFDPCMSCAVHVVDTQNGETTQVKVL